MYTTHIIVYYILLITNYKLLICEIIRRFVNHKHEGRQFMNIYWSVYDPIYACMAIAIYILFNYQSIGYGQL